MGSEGLFASYGRKYIDLALGPLLGGGYLGICIGELDDKDGKPGRYISRGENDRKSAG